MNDDDDSNNIINNNNNNNNSSSSSNSSSKRFKAGYILPLLQDSLLIKLFFGSSQITG